jgi:hypothetical protein
MIGQALGQVLSQAIGIAISPVPIILVIVVLFSRRAMTNASAFLVGWGLGVLAVFLIASAAVDGATATARRTPRGSSSSCSAWCSWSWRSGSGGAAQRRAPRPSRPPSWPRSRPWARPSPSVSGCC